ncbi:MAG TPA: FtsL-like putative cell division protein [Bacteroidales bacterium]|jgi:hypothetical protein|nr:FtsL-like putative cell division protein [Bacteroidales bacterium]
MATDKRNKDIKRNLQGLLNGSVLASDFVRKQMPYIILLALIALIYISNRYHAERVFRETEQTKKEIEELRAEKITIQSKLMRNSRRSELLRMLEEKGSQLKESPVPPGKIYYPKKESE